MPAIAYLFFLLLLPVVSLSQQVGIGTEHPHPFSILDISDTSRGVVLPRMTTAARLRLPDAKGMVVFDSTEATYYFNDGGGWTNLPPKGQHTGDLLYWNGKKWTAVEAGLGGQVLTLSSGSHIPVWSGPTTDTMFTDPRDNQQYRIAQFGQQVWMTQNLNYSPVSFSWCYDNSNTNCNQYGRLYDYYGALEAVPPGWHLPTDAEWDTLVNFLGGADVAGGAMKALTTWNFPNTGATNSSGFHALASGFYYRFSLSQGIFTSLGNEAFFYSSTLGGTYLDTPWIRKLSRNTAAVERTGWSMQDGMSVRCIKNY